MVSLWLLSLSISSEGPLPALRWRPRQRLPGMLQVRPDPSLWSFFRPVRGEQDKCVD